jgi:hypothetical protein
MSIEDVIRKFCGKMEFEWEPLYYDGNDATTFRVKVIGGWIVRYNYHAHEHYNESISMVFVPDPNHEWEIEQ